MTLLKINKLKKNVSNKVCLLHLKIYHYYLYSFTIAFNNIYKYKILISIFVLLLRPLFILCKRKYEYNLFMEVFSQLRYNINHNK